MSVVRYVSQLKFLEMYSFWETTVYAFRDSMLEESLFSLVLLKSILYKTFDTKFSL